MAWYGVHRVAEGHVAAVLDVEADPIVLLPSTGGLGVRGAPPLRYEPLPHHLGPSPQAEDDYGEDQHEEEEGSGGGGQHQHSYVE